MSSADSPARRAGARCRAGEMRAEAVELSATERPSQSTQRSSLARLRVRWATRGSDRGHRVTASTITRGHADQDPEDLRAPLIRPAAPPATIWSRISTVAGPKYEPATMPLGEIT